MQHQSIEQSSHRGSQSSGRDAFDHPERANSFPSSREVLFEFGVMLAVSLGLAVGARLLLVALDLQ